MSDLRLGDVLDDYCVKCRRLTNHSIVSLIEAKAAKVRCRTCYSDHDYRNEQIPPSKKDLKKAALFNQVLAANRMSEDQLIARLRQEIPRGDLLQAVTAGVVVPRPVIDAIYRFRNETRVADVVAIPLSAAGKIPTPESYAKDHQEDPGVFTQAQWYPGNSDQVAIGQAAYDQGLADAVAAVVRRQQETGIDVVNNGEFGHPTGQRYDFGAWWSYVYDRIGGWIR